MAIRIQLRRDTAANWVSVDPVLRAGEVGIETDTLKFKIGTGVRWTLTPNYANVTPSSLSNSLNDYILAASQGNPGGPAELDANGDLLVPEDAIILWNDATHNYTTTIQATQPTANRVINLPNATGTVALTSDLTPYAPLAGATFTGNIQVPTTVTFEGATADSYETALVATDPTADRTITLPDRDGTVITTGDTGTVTNTMLAGSIPNNKLANSSVTINGFEIALGGTAAYSTDNINEGTVNKYFSAELAQDAAALALANGTHTNITVSYDDNANAISLAAAPGYTNEEARDAVAGLITGSTHSGISVAYTDDGSNAGSLAFTNTGVTSLSGTANQISASGSTGSVTLSLPNAVTMPGSLTVSGNLTVNGTTTTVNATDLVVSDPLIYIGEGNTSNSVDLGLVSSFNDGTYQHSGLVRDASDNKWKLFRGVTDEPTTTVNFAQAIMETLVVGTIEGNLSGNVTGNVSGNAGTVTNGVYTTGTYSNPSWLTSLGWSKISSTPTTVSGYGITNAVVTDAANTITAASASTKPLILKGAASQSANYFEIQNSSGTAIAYINSVGSFITTDSITATGSVLATNGVYANTGYIGAEISAKPFLSTIVGIIVRAATSQTADLQQWQNSSGTVLAKVDASGNITAASIIKSGGTSSQFLKADGSTDSTTYLSGTVATTSGGTGLTSYATGDILYASATNTLSKLSAGTDGYLLTLASGVPTWAAAPISLPSQTGNSGKYLTTDGTTASWGTLVVPITTSTTTLSSNTATSIDTTALSGFTSLEYMVSLKQGSKIRTSKVVLQTDGTSVDMTEFAITETGGTMSGVVVSATTSGSNAALQLTVTDAATTNVTVKFSKITL